MPANIILTGSTKPVNEKHQRINNYDFHPLCELNYGFWITDYNIISKEVG